MASDHTTQPRPGELLEGLSRHLVPMPHSAQEHDALLQLIGPARFALLGEASHGTHEFYRDRAAITKRLIVEKGFTAVAVEADWPDAWRADVTRCLHQSGFLKVIGIYALDNVGG